MQNDFEPVNNRRQVDACELRRMAEQLQSTTRVYVDGAEYCESTGGLAAVITQPQTPFPFRARLTNWGGGLDVNSQATAITYSWTTSNVLTTTGLGQAGLWNDATGQLSIIIYGYGANTSGDWLLPGNDNWDTVPFTNPDGTPGFKYPDFFNPYEGYVAPLTDTGVGCINGAALAVAYMLANTNPVINPPATIQALGFQAALAASLAARTAYTDPSPSSFNASKNAGQTAYSAAILAAGYGSALATPAAAEWANNYNQSFTSALDDNGNPIAYNGRGVEVILYPTVPTGGPYRAEYYSISQSWYVFNAFSDVNNNPVAGFVDLHWAGQVFPGQGIGFSRLSGGNSPINPALVMPFLKPQQGSLTGSTPEGRGGGGDHFSDGLYIGPGDGKLLTAMQAAASTPGNVIFRLPIFDYNGNLLGYLPIYDQIT